MEGNSVESRLRRLEDESRIREIAALYGRYADTGDAKAYVDLYTDDGVYDMVTDNNFGIGYDGAKRVAGRQELLEFFDDPEVHQRMVGNAVHIQDMSMSIEIDGDTALAYSYSMTLLRQESGVVLRGAGMNRWTFRREASGWKIAERRRRRVGDYEVFQSIGVEPTQ